MRSVGWTLLFAIAALSFAPPEFRPVTIFPHNLEHVIIYFLAACAFGLAYSDDFVIWLVGLTGFTLVMEIVQLLIPGRHARVSDFLVDAFGVAMGLVGGVTLARVTRRA